MKNLKFLFLLLFLIPFFNVNAATELDYYSNDIHKSTTVVGWDLTANDYTYITPLNVSTGIYQISCNVGTSAYGCGISFDTGVQFKSGYYYSVKVYLGVATGVDNYNFARTSSYFNPAVSELDWGSIWNSYHAPEKLSLFSQYADGISYYIIDNYSSTIYRGNTITYIFKMGNDVSPGDILFIPILASESSHNIYFYGSITESLGSDLSTSELQRILGQSSQVIINQNEQIINNQNNIQNDLGDIIDSDLDDSDKVLPNDDSLEDYENVEGEIVDKIDDVSFNNVSIGIDSRSSSWVWNTLTSFIQSHSAIFGMFIAILSIGIIKLALGR